MRPVQRKPRLSAFQVGLIAAVLASIFVFWNFTKVVPFQNPYELKAAFEANSVLLPDSQVRIAGVTVGKVKSVETLKRDGKAQGRIIATMEISEAGRPIRKDATIKIRPRLFLEGNFFLDVKPGSPSAPELDDGDSIPVSQTAAPVQLDQVLSSLQSDTREDLKVLLNELGDSLVKHGGAEGFRDSMYSSPEAFRDTSRVNEAFLGTRPHDLSGLISNTQKVLRALGRNEGDLKGLVTNFNTVAAALASEDEALASAIGELPGVLEAGQPALRKLNAAFPSLRGFARDILPGVRNSEETLVASEPLVRELAGLFSRSELGRVARDLRVLSPRLTRLSKRSVGLLEQSRETSSCFNQVITPWSNMKVPDTIHPLDATVAEETAYGLVGIAGESRSGDANGQWVRVLGMGGPNMVQFNESFGTTALPILGTNPPKNAEMGGSNKPPLRPNEPCENQDPPDLRTTTGPAPEQRRIGTDGPIARLGLEQAPILRDFANASILRASGRKGAASDLEARARRRMREFNRSDLPRLLRALSSKPNGSKAARRLRQLEGAR